MSRLRSLFHPASVLSVVALTLGLGSTAFAAGMITGADIKDGTVTTADIHNGTLRTRDLADTTVNRLRGAVGPAGPRGPEGTPGLSGYEVVPASKSVAANTRATLHQDCPVGKQALSVEAFWDTSNDAVQVLVNGPGGDAYTSGVPAADTLHLQVVCATVG